METMISVGGGGVGYGSIPQKTCHLGALLPVDPPLGISVHLASQTGSLTLLSSEKVV